MLYKISVILGCLFFVTIAGIAQDKTHKVKDLPADIFLLIGQSNMAGVGPIGSLDTITLKNAYLFNDKNEWENVKSTETESTNRYSSVKKASKQKLSPGYTFAKKMAFYTGKAIGIVSNARGGTTISWWQKGYEGENDFNLYEEAVARAKAALAATPGAKIKGIIWHQGEGDNSKTSGEYYLQRLSKLVADLRTDLGDNNIPFIAGEVGKWNNRGLSVNPKIRLVKDSIPNADNVTSDGLTSINLEKNDPHFDTYSQRVLGGRYADKAYELVYKKKLQGVTLFNEADFNGRSVLLIPGNYTAVDMEAMGIPVKEISSLKIDKKYKIQLFSEGLKREILSADKDLPSINITDLPAVIKVIKTEKIKIKKK